MMTKLKLLRLYYKRRGMYIFPKPFFSFKGWKSYLNICIDIASKKKGDTLDFGDYVTIEPPSSEDISLDSEVLHEARIMFDEQIERLSISTELYGLRFKKDKVEYILKSEGTKNCLADPLNQRQHNTYGWKIKGEILI